MPTQLLTYWLETFQPNTASDAYKYKYNDTCQDNLFQNLAISIIFQKTRYIEFLKEFDIFCLN